MKRKLRMGMVGGSSDAFIGAVHRRVAALDGYIELVCGAFSSNPEKSKATGKSLFLSPDRVYESYTEMIEAEKKLPPDKRMDFISIVTPNHVHFAPAKLALENGFHVICDKPMTLSLAEAKQLKRIADKSGLVFALTHTYTGYPMVKEARQLVRKGVLGAIRKIYVEYTQGWLSQPIERTGQKQASWRSDPKYSGLGGAIADIGTHAANLAEFISGQTITELCADLQTVVAGRVLDDDATMLLRFDGGATGMLVATQVAAGEENNLFIRVYGEKGGLEWRQEEPNTLVVKWPDKPRQILRTGLPYVGEEAKAATRVPSGHPEGYLEAFANIYVAFARAVNDHRSGKKIDPHRYGFPDVNDGVRGMAFIEAAVKSSRQKQKWVRIPV
ncbi:MAG: Gfo/Idh/MocA family oxidoreductase [Cyclobacteriaceae bacterium]|nr:Gfo/Idh/MocA family oxidoreductase [Cyclobacteriaceae bacterium]MDW8331503.1 Gfo/Idh/MocA family oxidoreductase [Cyclobacteriaceae bacterium]